MDETATRPGTPWLPSALAAAGAAAAVLALLAAGGARDAAEAARVEAVAASRASDAARKSVEEVAKEIAGMRADFEIMAASLDAAQRNIKELADRMDAGGGFGPMPGQDQGGEAPPAQPFLEYTPDLREALRKAVAAK